MQRPFDRILESLDSWRSRLSQGWNVQSVAIVALLCLALIALFAMQPNQTESSATLTDLFLNRTLTATELERIEAALGQAMLLDYKLDNGRIRVPANKRGQYLSAIRDAKALPQSFHVPTEEAISSATWIENSRQQSQRLHHALEKEARLAICALPGVLDAFVHIDVVADESLYRRTKASAVVGVKTPPDQPLDEQSFRTIQAMLLNFKAGLAPEAVTITDLTSRNHFRGSMDKQSPETITAFRRADLERVWTQKLTSAISFASTAKLIVNVTPTQDARRAESVRCSVSVPRHPIVNESRAAKANDEKEIRQRIQSALLPLLPGQSANANELVAVTVFDQTNTQHAPISRWQRVAKSPNLLASILVAVAGVMTLLLMRSPQDTVATVNEPPPSLKIYEGQDAAGRVELGAATTEQLNAIVAEDPEAVAESLSDFIDRAS